VRKVFWLAIFVIGMLALLSSAGGQLKREDFQRADKATVRLNPNEFPRLPMEVRTALEDRGCTIPQPYDSRGEKKNVIRGRFHSAGQADWAVLCSHEGLSKILVFYDGRPAQVDEIAQEADLQYLQVISGGQEIGYSRQLGVATPTIVRQRLARSTRNSRSIEHDGVENIFLEKGSEVWYNFGKKWVQLAGAD
jgi:hypothetical protein